MTSISKNVYINKLDDIVNKDNTTYKKIKIIAQKKKFSIKDLFIKCDQIHTADLSQLVKKSLMENFFFCAVNEAC